MVFMKSVVSNSGAKVLLFNEMTKFLVNFY